LQKQAVGLAPVRGSFSSSALPEGSRLDSWRDLFGRQFLRLDIDPLDDGTFRFDTRFLTLPGLTVSAGEVSAIRCTRTAELAKDNNDDLVLLLPKRGEMQISERGREAVIGTGDAFVWRSSEVGQTVSTGGSYVSMSVPCKAVASQVLDVDRLRFAVIPRENATLRLLDGYLDLLLNGPVANGPAEENGTLMMAARHVHEIAGALLDDTRANWERLRGPGGGLQAARVAAIHADIARHVTEPDYSIADVARRQGLAPGYIRNLLAMEGDRFSDLLRAARLDLAYRILTDRRHDRARIVEITYHCGFNDVSYFNRCFRQRFGATPGDVRRSRVSDIGR
jgi:AraC-like DNA-binding protein